MCRIELHCKKELQASIINNEWPNKQLTSNSTFSIK